MRYYLLIIIFVLFLSGCSDGVNYFYSPDSAQCTIQCRQLIKENWCSEGYASFGLECKCIMLDCLRNVTVQEQPENYTDFRSSNSISISQSYSKEVIKMSDNPEAKRGTE